MRIITRYGAALGVALLAGLGAARAGTPGTPENTQFLPLWITPLDAAAQPGPPALLNLPPGWQGGDAAVVVAPGGNWPPGLRDRLVSAFIDAGSAVVELHPAGEPVLAKALADALHAARVALGAGVVVALGHGEGHRAALAAPLGYAATAVFGPGGPHVTQGVAPPPAEGWAPRALLFCGLIAAGLGEASARPDASCAAVLARDPG